MAFESLTERLNGVFKKLRGKGKLNEADIKAAMREVRMALLEADVNYKVAKDFCAQVSERAMGQEVMESLTPAQQVVKIVNEELTNLMGGNEPKYLRLKNKGQTVLMIIPFELADQHDILYGRATARPPTPPSSANITAARVAARCWSPAIFTAPPPLSS